MKLIASSPAQWEFEFTHEEQVLWRHVLQQYPLVPAAQHRLSKVSKIPDAVENQLLLEASLQSQRLENRRQIEALLQAPGRFTETAEGYRAAFTPGEIEWLLQVMNDVRVGSWLALGAPDLALENYRRSTKKTAPHLMNMEVAAFFEMHFLNALHGED